MTLVGLWKGLKTLLGIAETVREIADVVEDVADTQRTGAPRPLSPEDVRRQQAQIARATSYKVPPYKVPPRPKR